MPGKVKRRRKQSPQSFIEPWLRKITRDLVLFVVGLCLTINEAVIRQGPERPAILTLFASMMGLPIIIRAQEKRNSELEEEDQGEAGRGNSSGGAEESGT